MTPNPIYIVSGFPRSGTSMMMRALEAGGLAAIHDGCRTDAVRRNSTLIPGYDPNPHGFYECDDLGRLDWSACVGRCVKVVRDNLCDHTPSAPFAAVYLTRDPAEIRRSFPGTMSGPPGPATFNFLHDYWGTVEADCRMLAGRAVSLVRLHYPDVVADPRAAFSALAAAGWPIDVDRAAATVDPDLYRHRGA